MELEKKERLRIMELYLVIFHEATKDAFAWLTNCPGGQFGFAPDYYLEKQFGYIPHNSYNAAMEKFFAEQLTAVSLCAEDKREIYLMFCKFFKQKSIASKKENHDNEN